MRAVDDERAHCAHLRRRTIFLLLRKSIHILSSDNPNYELIVCVICYAKFSRKTWTSFQFIQCNNSITLYSARTQSSESEKRESSVRWIVVDWRGCSQLIGNQVCRICLFFSVSQRNHTAHVSLRIFNVFSGAIHYALWIVSVEIRNPHAKLFKSNVSAFTTYAICLYPTYTVNC